MQFKMNISLIQYSPIWEDVEENIKKLSNMIDSVHEDTDLVILPEMFNTGFSLSPERLAEPMHGTTVNWMRETAINNKIAIMGSLMVYDKKKFYDRLMFIFPDGSFKHYDKRHLYRYANEEELLTPGKQRLIVNYNGWRICPLICSDISYPVWSANRNDYDLLVYVANWPESMQKSWDVLPVARAIENQCYVAAVNRIGDDEAEFYKGESKIIDFDGEIMAQSKQIREEIISTTLDYEKLAEYRHRYDLVTDADQFGIFF